MEVSTDPWETMSSKYFSRSASEVSLNLRTTLNRIFEIGKLSTLWEKCLLIYHEKLNKDEFQVQSAQGNYFAPAYIAPTGKEVSFSA